MIQALYCQGTKRRRRQPRRDILEPRNGSVVDLVERFQRRQFECGGVIHMSDVHRSARQPPACNDLRSALVETVEIAHHGVAGLLDIRSFEKLNGAIVPVTSPIRDDDLAAFGPGAPLDMVRTAPAVPARKHLRLIG